MEAFFTVLSVLAIFLMIVVFGTLVGAVVGWIVGWFFSNAILTTFSAFGVAGLSMWKLGATLGFVSGFFKTVVTK